MQFLPSTSPPPSDPKSELFTFCMRRKMARPKFALLERRDNAWVVEFRLGEMRSGEHAAPTRKEAEKSACRALLLKLAESVEAPEPDEGVSAEEEEALRDENPKGKLLEACLLRGLRPPVFEVHPVVTTREGGMFEGCARLELPNGEEIWAPLRRARSEKTVEHAAAKALLEDEAFPPLPLPTAQQGPDARSVLSQMRQGQRIKDYGFERVAQEGPPHAPLFKVRAWAEGWAGTRYTSEIVSARSKKEGEELSARALIGVLECARRAV